MLLAFFMVLNAISTFDETKSRPVVQSIEKTFGTEVRSGGIAPTEEETEDPQSQVVGVGHAFEKLDELFHAEIPSFTSKIIEENNMMFVRMKESEFRTAMGMDAAGPPNEFMKKFLEITSPKNQEQRYEINVLAGIGDNPAYAVTKGYTGIETAVRLAGSYGEKLIAAGLPPHLISVGLQRGRAGFVDIYFTRYMGPPAPPESRYMPTREELRQYKDKIAPLLEEQKQ